jgi:hypothetical protein
MTVTCSILIGRNKMGCAMAQAESGGPFRAEANINAGLVVDKVAVEHFLSV